MDRSSGARLPHPLAVKRAVLAAQFTVTNPMSSPAAIRMVAGIRFPHGAPVSEPARSDAAETRRAWRLVLPYPRILREIHSGNRSITPAKAVTQRRSRLHSLCPHSSAPRLRRFRSIASNKLPHFADKNPPGISHYWLNDPSSPPWSVSLSPRATAAGLRVMKQESQL